jgi:hypothetical protein
MLHVGWLVRLVAILSVAGHERDVPEGHCLGPLPHNLGPLWGSYPAAVPSANRQGDFLFRSFSRAASERSCQRLCGNCSVETA